MRTALLTLIGFSAFILCHSFCPMNTGMVAMDHDMDHGMHMAHVHEDTDSTACEHCEERVSEDLALTKTHSVTSTTTVVSDPVVLQPIRFAEHTKTSVPRSHLAAASPPIASTIVRTIVLRT